MTDVVLCSVDKRGVATVTLNRPERNNAYNSAVIDALIAGVESLAADPAVRVVVIRGNGKHFQAGADLSWLKEMGQLSPLENIEVSRRTASAIQGLTAFPKPTIALIHGGCFGGGTGIAAAADIVIASEDAIFAITEARWGVMAGIIVPHLNAAMGVRNVRRYALTCERFGAQAAKEMGLVHQVCPEGGLDEAVAPVIDNLLMAAPEALAQTKHRALVEAGLDLSGEHFTALVEEHALKRQSDEAKEGLASFLEKRPPSWYPGDAA
ncbi:enoyl-CoA hydratase-related protein [Thalassobaculum sp. OXR-137]|uniref:enoyl-CoA hydratase-related protein n=1 Tax=Thalassobaculum sp. OXR-137 TaxID=3100173 RepID=UPI002AC8CDAE|nr:enoyl-CoA hydratase-related protein [Thalassobaculum sp. OXR-137]WPZ34596.1 enoyl-CoA hydratase-related protein [Thalassobaculum sp. OXR-137]